MRAIIQRVQHASVTVDQQITGQIQQGILILLGAGHDDSADDLQYILDKTVNLRIFPDQGGKMNLSLLDIKGDLLIVSQFTLYGDARKGRRPSFIQAMHPEPAEALYQSFINKAKQIEGLGMVASGVFGADMKVSLLNDGPVTIMLDSSKAF